MEHQEATSRPGEASKPLTSNETHSVENGNINPDFQAIVSSQELIQDQLNKLELQVAQTAVDLNQLVDRSKNNNQSLGKLMQEISNAGNSQKSLDILNNVNTSVVNLKESIQLTLNEIANLRKTQSEEINQLNKEMGKQLSLINDSNNDKETQNLSDEFQKLSSELKQIVTRDTFLQEREQKLDSKEKDLIAREKALEMKEEQLQEKQNSIENIEKNHENMLQQKYANLEAKYKSLCDVYTNKFNEFKSLEQEFIQFSELVDQQTFSQSQTNKVRKMHQLHSQVINEFKAPNMVIEKKRIVSTPLK